MIRQIFVGLISEGPTDNRFLESIVNRTFNEIAFECTGDIETVVVPLKIESVGLDFVEKTIKASEKGTNEYGIMVLCVHTDADGPSETKAFEFKIVPAQDALSEKATLCQILVALIPVQMIEAWMLADKELFKHEIGTSLRDIDLNIHRDPEQIADPKFTIQEAIRIAREGMTKRRRHELNISDLYSTLGQKIAIEKLNALRSFQNFKESVREAYRKLNYLH